MEVLEWIIFGLFLLILLGLIILSLPLTKGWAGERVVRVVLRTLPKDKYIVLNDLYFRQGRNTCQIDHLVISPYGIFCIETKNYLGIISGNYKDKNLRRKVLFMNYPTYNPIWQNYVHLQKLVSWFPIIKEHKKALHSIVCFLPGAKVWIKGEGAAIICKAGELKKEILSFTTPILPEKVCKEIAVKLTKASKRHKTMKFS